MPYEDVEKFERTAKGKIKFLEEHFGRYFLRAVMAGFFITVAMIYSNVIGSLFKESDPAMGKFLGGIVFSVAVLLITFIGSELFTGNNFMMAFGAYQKGVSWKAVGKVWLFSYIGNFVGCFVFSLIFVGAGASGTADYFAGIIDGKLTIPAGQLFLRAVLCNFFVCLAIVCGNKMKEEGAKFLMIVICISGFVVAGFEHSIANMSTFTTSVLLVPGVSIAAVLRSMLIVTVGNIVGGAVLLAWPLWKMSAPKE